MITPTNQSKHTITPVVSPKGGYVLWGDTIHTWGDAISQWGGQIVSVTNQSKHIITPTNQSKS